MQPWVELVTAYAKCDRLWNTVWIHEDSPLITELVWDLPLFHRKIVGIFPDLRHCSCGVTVTHFDFFLCYLRISYICPFLRSHFPSSCLSSFPLLSFAVLSELFPHHSSFLLCFSYVLSFQNIIPASSHCTPNFFHFHSFEYFTILTSFFCANTDVVA